MSIACEYGIPAIYAEYLGGAQCSEEGVSDYINGCLNVLGRLGMMNRVQPESRVKTIVEDPVEVPVICRCVILQSLTGFLHRPIV